MVHDLITQESDPLNFEERERLVEQVLDEIFGLGPLEPLLKDPDVSDILVNTYKQVYIERHGKLEQTDVALPATTRTCCRSSTASSRAVGRRVDESSPMVDARLPDGSRVNAIIPPLALDGPACSRSAASARRADRPRTCCGTRALTAGMLELLEAVVKARLNILISGGTGSGKTTLLNALSSLHPGQRAHRHHRGRGRAAAAAAARGAAGDAARQHRRQGRGPPAACWCVNALRMRPDRIIIGECRGAEALDMLQAMNTGHDGSMTTVHANTPRDALSRLETMVVDGQR